MCIGYWISSNISSIRSNWTQLNHWPWSTCCPLDLCPHTRQWEADPGAAFGHRNRWPRQSHQQHEQSGQLREQRLPELGVLENAVSATHLLWPWDASHTIAGWLWRGWQPTVYDYTSIPVPTATSIHWSKYEALQWSSLIHEVVCMQTFAYSPFIFSFSPFHFRLNKGTMATHKCCKSAESQEQSHYKPPFFPIEQLNWSSDT